MTESDNEEFEERAAIIEYDSGLSREEAERLARGLMRHETKPEKTNGE